MFYVVSVFFPIGLVALALVRKRPVWYQGIATVLFLQFLLVSLFGFDAVIRSAGTIAENSSDAPAAFSMILSEMHERLQSVRWSLMVLGACFWVLILMWPVTPKAEQ